MGPASRREWEGRGCGYSTNQSTAFQVGPAWVGLPKKLPTFAREEVDLLAVVERDLDGLLDVDLLELGHRVLDDLEVDVVPDRVERRVDARVARPGRRSTPSGSNWLL